MRRLSLRQLLFSGRRDPSFQSPEVSSLLLLLRRHNYSVIPKINSSGSSPLPHDGISPFLRPSLSHFRQNPLQLSSRRIDARNVFLRRFCSVNERDDISIEEDAERKAGWLLKLIFVATGSVVAFQFFPYMGDNLLQQSISLLHVKDPLFKRMGASRLSRFAIDDERRMKVVEMGGAEDLLSMLKAAKDDKTRKEALKALVALSHSDGAAEVLHQAGAISIVSSTPDSTEHAEVEAYKSSLLKRFQELKHDGIPLKGEVS